LLLGLEVPRDVRDQVLDDREGAHGLDRDRLAGRHLAHAGHAHETGQAVDLGRAGAALARLAVPPDREVVGLLGLDLVDHVEDVHAGRRLGPVLDVLALAAGAAPDAQGDGCAPPTTPGRGTVAVVRGVTRRRHF